MYIFIISILLILISIISLRCICKKDSSNKEKNKVAAFITSAIPLIGQLLSRFIYLDDPYVNLWLLIPIFWFPPFSFFASYLIYNNMNLC